MDYGPSYEKNIMYFKESNDFLTIENKKFINEKILSNFFPFYRNFTLTSSKDKNIFLSHVLLVRPEERINKNHINSSYFLETLSFQRLVPR
jgi:hypothetical protein